MNYNENLEYKSGYDIEKTINDYLNPIIKNAIAQYEQADIQSSYSNKFVENYWILRQLDRYMYGHNGFIAGGCFKNLFNKEKIKDIDIFFENEEDWNKAVLYYNSMTVGYGSGENKIVEEKAEYIFCYENSKVKAYKNKNTGVRVELCRAIFGTPKEVLNSFDFSITKFAYYKDKNEENGIEYKILCHKDFFEHLFMKRLVTDDKILYPMSTFERMIRYIGYGYNPCKETKIKIALAINDLNREQIAVNESLYDGLD